jgi:CRISPR-associated protein Csb2
MTSPTSEVIWPTIEALRWRVLDPIINVADAPRLLAALRGALMAAVGSDIPATLHGHAADGTPLVGHRHAYYVPVALEGTRVLEVVAMLPGSGFELRHVRRFADVDALWGKRVDGTHFQVRIGLVLVGELERVAPELTGTTRRWRSLTPFLPHRHPKRGGLESFLAEEVERELGAAGKPARVVNLTIERGPTYLAGRERLHPRSSFLLDLLLDRALTGPLILGEQAHLGLGALVATEPPATDNDLESATEASRGMPSPTSGSRPTG